MATADRDPDSAQRGSELRYSDGVVTLRPLGPEDLEADLEAKDEEQIRWMWAPDERAAWESMSPTEQREHALRGLIERRESFGRGPKWCFAVDTQIARYVAYLDFDLASPMVPAGAANIAYSCHPAHRGQGHVHRALRLLMRFIVEHTQARQAHILVERANEASLRVARSVATRAPEAFADKRGQAWLRFVLDLG